MQIDFTHDLRLSDGQALCSVDLVVEAERRFGGVVVTALYTEELVTKGGVATYPPMYRLVELPAADPITKRLIEQISASEAFAREFDEARMEDAA